MKIGILTHYNVSSHGALLQMYGLQETLLQLGHEVYILTYNPNMDFIDEDTRKRFSASFRNLPYYLNSYLVKNGLPMMVYQYKKQRILRRFRQQNFQLIPYTEVSGLDCVVVGSDEVFALENGLDPVMFGHGFKVNKLIAYAPSCGQTDLKRIDDYGCRELIQSGLQKFTALSARDVGTKQVIDDLTGSKVSLVCDPALLYPYRHPSKKTEKKYIVVYSYQSNFKEKERINTIKEYAKKVGCEIWSVGVYYKWCDKQINCDPLKMIEIFANAQAVITDTFHGTITSYIAHTPMAVFVRKNNNVKLDHLLDLIGIADRKVSSLDYLKTVLEKPIDFSALDENVKKLREDGKKYLVTSLS